MATSSSMNVNPDRQKANAIGHARDLSLLCCFSANGSETIGRCAALSVVRPTDTRRDPLRSNCLKSPIIILKSNVAEGPAMSPWAREHRRELTCAVMRMQNEAQKTGHGFGCL